MRIAPPDSSNPPALNKHPLPKSHSQLISQIPRPIPNLNRIIALPSKTPITSRTIRKRMIDRNKPTGLTDLLSRFSETGVITRLVPPIDNLFPVYTDCMPMSIPSRDLDRSTDK
jgi:hypothetical protein